VLSINTVCPATRDKLIRSEIGADDPIPDGALWIDLLNPTLEEDRKVEQHLRISIPTREEMRDLEPSEIIYTENHAHYMTARVICRTNTTVPKLADVTFILTEKALVTVRYDEPGAFTIFQNRVTKPDGCGLEPSAVIEGLIEAIVDRAAEVLRGVGDQIEEASRGAGPQNSDRARQATSPRSGLGQASSSLSHARTRDSPLRKDRKSSTACCS